MRWKRAALPFFLIIVLTSVFEITFRVMFKPEVVSALRSRLFSATLCDSLVRDVSSFPQAARNSSIYNG
jgi:hypothetical protein